MSDAADSASGPASGPRPGPASANPASHEPAPWTFDDATGPARLHQSLAEHGYALCRAPGLAAAAERDPWAVAQRLHGAEVDLVESHPIHPVPHGRSFAATNGFTPLHTDSQSRRGVPPRWQVMLCASPASLGGETLLLDGWALLERIEAEDPALHHALLTRPRRIPFVFGDVVGPTVALRGGGVVLTHSPMPPSDDVGRRLAPWIARVPCIELRVRSDEVLVVDNHRMLHGRRAFEDPARRFVRLLVWTGIPAAAPPRLHAAAFAVHERLARALRRQPLALREAFLGGADPSVAERPRKAFLGAPDPSTADPRAREPTSRLRIVLEMLRGTSPGILAQRHGVPEPELYRWRDAALRAAEEALAEPSSPAEHHAALERLLGKLDRKLP